MKAGRRHAAAALYMTANKNNTGCLIIDVSRALKRYSLFWPMSDDDSRLSVDFS